MTDRLCRSILQTLFDLMLAEFGNRSVAKISSTRSTKRDSPTFLIEKLPSSKEMEGDYSVSVADLQGCDEYFQKRETVQYNYLFAGYGTRDA